MSGEPTSDFGPPIVEAEIPQTPTVAAKGFLDYSLRDIRNRTASVLRNNSGQAGAVLASLGGGIAVSGFDHGTPATYILGGGLSALGIGLARLNDFSRNKNNE